MTLRLASALLLGWALPGSLLAGPPPASLPRTGQTACYQGTAAAPCAGTGQDGETETGVAWPVPRFGDGANLTVIDRLTGLTWARDANALRGPATWQQALDHVKTLNAQRHLGHADWRLPNVGELGSLLDKQPNLLARLRDQGYTDVQADAYWTSTTYASHPAYAWTVGTYSGIAAGRGKQDVGYVWPVRGEGPGVCNLPRTGQTDCRDAFGTSVACRGTGQDGDLRAGVAWPVPRFAVSSVQRTVTDALTGLVWTRDANTPGVGCGPGRPKAWQDALDHVKCLNRNHFLGRTDWRLPNGNELASLVHRGQPNTAVWLNAEGFSDVQPSSYWSSSTYPYNVWNAWSVNLHDGAVSSMAKRHEIHVWPVRGP